jgi:hypothetical protein
VLRENSDQTDQSLCVNRLVYTKLSLLYIFYENPQLVDNAVDFIIVNGEVIYNVNISDFKFGYHLLDLKINFDRLQQANLSLKPSKCAFGNDKIKILGHKVSVKGISPVEYKIQIINDARSPITVKGVRQFLGLAGYYRKYILNFSKIAASLTDIIKGVLKSKAITWIPECQKAFVIEGLSEFEPYIRGRFVQILTDHAALKLISTIKTTTRQTRQMANLVIIIFISSRTLLRFQNSPCGRY